MLPEIGLSILLIHGGAWSGTGKEVYRQLGTQQTLEQAGFRTRSIDYAHADARRALADVVGAGRRLGSGSVVICWGDSAGGHLALLAAQKGACDTVVAVSAVADPLALKRAGKLPAGLMDVVFRGRWRELSPLAGARAGKLRGKRVFLADCSRDPLVDPRVQGGALVQAARTARGARVRRIVVPGACHAHMPAATRAAVRWLHTLAR